MTDFEHRVTVHPGYDYRDTVDDGRGAHNLSVRFDLIGPLGVVTWLLNTGWVKRPLAGSYDRTRGPQLRRARPGADFRLRDYSPSAGPVSAHAPTPMKDWWSGPQECDVLPGGQCFVDTGYVIGDRVMNAMFNEGHPGIWRELEATYQSCFVDDETEE